jgi:catechol 2,3-dioxygenase-like lactoylglutathione lyase family enzyme
MHPSNEEIIMRVQLALNVKNLDAAVEFYSKLFDIPVHKRKPGYALGVEVFDDGDVHAATDRLKAAGLVEAVEDEQTCCYATQNKVWALDPQGTRWEYYRIVEDSETFSGSGSGSGSGESSGESDASPAPEGQAGCCR